MLLSDCKPASLRAKMEILRTQYLFVYKSKYLKYVL